MAEEVTEASQPLGQIERILIENLTLAERNAELEAENNKFKIIERRNALRNHLVTKFKIDLNLNDFVVDPRTATVKIKPKNAS